MFCLYLKKNGFSEMKGIMLTLLCYKYSTTKTLLDYRIDLCSNLGQFCKEMLVLVDFPPVLNECIFLMEESEIIPNLCPPVSVWSMNQAGLAAVVQPHDEPVDTL